MDFFIAHIVFIGLGLLQSRLLFFRWKWGGGIFALGSSVLYCFSGAQVGVFTSSSFIGASRGLWRFYCSVVIFYSGLLVCVL